MSLGKPRNSPTNIRHISRNVQEILCAPPLILSKPLRKFHSSSTTFAFRKTHTIDSTICRHAELPDTIDATAVETADITMRKMMSLGTQAAPQKSISRPRRDINVKTPEGPTLTSTIENTTVPRHAIRTGRHEFHPHHHITQAPYTVIRTTSDTTTPSATCYRKELGSRKYAKI